MGDHKILTYYIVNWKQLMEIIAISDFISHFQEKMYLLDQCFL